jgi:FKBP-type peptidyl-prolyl cis-trans isomerase
MIIRNLFLSIIIIALGAGCNKISYRKTAGGMPYKVFPGKDTTRIMPGNTIKINLTQKIKDSVYFTTEGKIPVFFPVPPTIQPYDLSEVWLQLRKGDSIITTQMMDTFIARNPVAVPPQFKKGDRIITYIKILDVFTNDSLARAENKKLLDELTQKEIAEMQKYLAGKKINAQKTPSGTFVEIKNPGTGNLIDSGNYITVNYTGTTFSGKVFDSNTDTAFHHAQPYSYITQSEQMIKGFDEAMLLLRKGAVARIYVPSMLAYGGNPGHPDIKPYENLIFDVAIVDVKEKMPEQPPTNLPNNPKN